MPTAAKLVGSLLFALLGFLVTRLAEPLMEGLSTVSSAAMINAAIGAGVGWFIAGPRAGGGWRAGLDNGLTTTICGLFLTIGTQGAIFMLRMAMRGHYRDPMDALEAMADYWLAVAARLAVPQIVLLLVLGGLAIGLLLEITRARAS